GKWLSDYQDRTVVLAPSLTRENIIEAFKARRVYAVQDRHIQIEFSINDQIMGSTLSAEEKTYHIKVEVLHKSPEEGKPFERVELISDGGMVVALNEEKSFHIKWDLILQSEEARYFFIRVVNEAGKRAWTAPIWTGRAPKAEKTYEKGTRIPFEQITIASQSSEQEQAKAIEILNKDTMTYWESEETSGQIILDLGASKEIVGIGYRKNYIPYEDSKALAKLMDHYEYAVSETLEGEEQVVASGRVRNYGKEHYRGFEKVKARYIKIRALDAVEKGTVAIGNIYIYEA
ncbi:MAG: discoidin domain-containing protein, partial [Cellulosilyticaceae bacterium]